MPPALSATHTAFFPEPFALMIYPYRPFVAPLAFALFLSACSQETAPATQVAAQVNQNEISIHQVQQVLQRQPRLAAAQPQAAPRLVLDSLVEQELAAQAARQAGMDTDPSVVQALEGAKREVLARAYQDRLAAQAVVASTDEIDRYYDSRPELFSARRLYTLQEFLVEATPEDVARIQEAVKAAKTVVEVIEVLRKAGLRNQTRQMAHAAEDLAMVVLQSVAKLSEGQSAWVAQPGSLRIYTVLHAQAAPADRNAARLAVESYLLGERKRQAVTLGMKTLRDAATITYQGAFAPASSAAASGAAAQPVL
jgi:EpsD family peptidyl-prolyl cis-trans isomerase